MYLIDSDVLIAAKNSHYAFDIVPAFWDWLVRSHVAGKVFVVEKVAEELLAGQDELAEWVKRQPKSFQLAPGPADTASMAKVAQWANSAGYPQGAVATFLSAGDFYVVSQALTLNYVVVTHEKPEPQSKKRIKIPDACNAVGVRWMNSFQMLKVEQAKFVLGILLTSSPATGM